MLTILNYIAWFLVLGVFYSFLPTDVDYPWPGGWLDNLNYYFTMFKLFLDLPILNRIMDYVSLWLILWFAIMGANLIFKVAGILSNSDRPDKLKIK